MKHLLRRRCTGLGALLFAFLIVVPAGAESFKLKMKKMDYRTRFISQGDDPDFLYRMTYPQHFWIQGDATVDRSSESEFPSRAKVEPKKYRCDHPFRGVVKLGSDAFAFVLDSSGLESKGYDLLYFDANGNGDLTDEDPIKAMELPGEVTFTSSYIPREFPRVDVTVHADGEEVDYAFFFFAGANIVEGRSFYSSASLYPAAYREGEVTLDGKRHRIVLLDFNSNGRYDDEYGIQERMMNTSGQVYARPGDMFLVDPNVKDRTTAGYGPTERKERRPVTKLVCVDDRYYECALSPSGDTLTLNPSSLPLGAVKNPNEQYAAMVYDGEGRILKVGGTKGKAVPIPEGEWKLLDCLVDFTKTAGGSGATFVTATASGDYPPVKVAKGKTVELPFGPPYKPVVSVSRVQQSSAGPTAVLDMKLVGTAGETCTNLMVKGNQPGKPTFAIATPKGKIVERGNFEYG